MIARETLLERIKKLLALAGNNPSMAEAEAAAAKAQALMDEHRITEADLAAAEGLEGGIHHQPIGPMALWRANFLASLSQLNGGKVLQIDRTRRDHVRLIFIAPDEQRDVILYLFEVICRLIENAAVAEAQLSAGPCKMSDFINGFCFAAQSTIAQRMREAARKDVGTALVRQGDALARYVAENFNVKPLRRKSVEIPAAAADAGVRFGQNATWSSGVNGGPGPERLK